jgi:hypothetical protein
LGGEFFIAQRVFDKMCDLSSYWQQWFRAIEPIAISHHRYNHRSNHTHFNNCVVYLVNSLVREHNDVNSAQPKQTETKLAE